MGRILIVPSHPMDYKEDDIKELIALLKAEFPKEIEIEYSPAELMRKGMYGVTFWQFIKIYLEDVPAEIRGAIVAKLVDAGVAIIKKVLSKRKNNKRPNAVLIYDEFKNEIGSAVMSNSRQKARSGEEYAQWSSDKYNKKHKRKSSKKRRSKR